ncbi:hypothetical protein HK104_010998 [Borealophlyctis nickersoniae]|nr:hypothetical protein HK104_010998 [Borealophlyctis nickersoniae]
MLSPAEITTAAVEMSSVETEKAFKGTFSFDRANIRETRLGPNLLLRLERSNHGVARLYFVDDTAAEVPIPPNFVVKDLTVHEVVRPFAKGNSFCLCWTDNYEIRHNGEEVLWLENQRLWGLRSSP